jgi:hypothetical protein
MQHLWSRFESVVEVELRFTHGAGKVLTPFSGLYRPRWRRVGTLLLETHPESPPATVLSSFRRAERQN